MQPPYFPIAPPFENGIFAVLLMYIVPTDALASSVQKVSDRALKLLGA